MSLLTIPLRAAGALFAWALGASLVIVIDVSITHGHQSEGWLVAAPVLAFVGGAIPGAAFWRASRSRPHISGLLLAGLFCLLIAAAWIGGSAMRA
jgi:uncharacterized membrane protein YoaK (UPF0700 family)